MKERKMGLEQAIKSLDAFPRTEEHLLQKTQSGALVSIVVSDNGHAVLHELTYYLPTNTVHQLFISKVFIEGDRTENKFEQTLSTALNMLVCFANHGHIIGTEYLSDLVERSMLLTSMIFGGATHVNVSHVIHDLSFGPKYPGLHNLDGTHISIHSSAVFTVLQIVPTEYRYISKEVLPDKSVFRLRILSPMKAFDRTWPAVYFLYDLSPITVTIKRAPKLSPFHHSTLCSWEGIRFNRLLEEVTKASGGRASQ
ncbi:citrate synthase, glyoxysomal [Hibiscus syriacus]|uniref:Citrate synthase, glyoxysomal n=1 Tax=Hibiscus syriacus TaxID=106335 RepID=A0A6A3D1H3_HIBSY|nr:citrate synthase, glyoxysomal [Hibiscus syriacus]